MIAPIRLGVNIDHAATLRNARGGAHPSPARAALAAQRAGADGVTLHIREDRRHVREADLEEIQAEVRLPLNLEMAATPPMRAIALAAKPHAVCIVPERREERTTEGGLDAAAQEVALAPLIQELTHARIRVSLFIDPEARQIEAARRLGAFAVELHTGDFCNAGGEAAEREFARLARAAGEAAALGLEVHAGHGLDYATAQRLAGVPQIVEMNIGHFLIGEALFVGLEAAVARMREAIAIGRAA